MKSGMAAKLVVQVSPRGRTRARAFLITRACPCPRTCPPTMAQLQDTKCRHPDRAAGHRGSSRGVRYGCRRRPRIGERVKP